MKIISIISEYNPFHLGHLHQIKTIKEKFKNEEICILTIMSGNFVQRGEPSIIDKFKRCRISLSNGINLCLELPTQFALSSAEGFALGAINLLNELNIVDYICFGCEILDIEKLNTIVEMIENISKSELKFYLNKGLSFPKSRELVIRDKLKDTYLQNNFLSLSNNILAIEYMRALKLLNSTIKVLPIQRIGSDYNSEILSTSFSSATAIRKEIELNSLNISNLYNHLPKETFLTLENCVKNKNFVLKEQMFNYLKYKLITNNNINKIEDVSEGLDNKIYSNIIKSNSLQELILNVKSKRYTYSRISRILTKYFIGFENFEKNEIKKLNKYIRILGFDKIGLEVLNKIKKKTQLTLIPKFSKKNSHMAPLDILSTKAYSILNSNININEDFIQYPIIK